MFTKNYIFDVIIIIVIIIIIFIINNVMQPFFGCCWYSGCTHQSLNCWSSCNVRGKMGAGGMGGDSGIVMEYVCEDAIQNVDWRLVSMLMRAGILVGGLIVVEVGVMEVVALGVVSFSEE